MKMIAGTGKAKAGEPSLTKCAVSPYMMGNFQRRFARSFQRGIVKPFTSRWQQHGRFLSILRNWPPATCRESQGKGLCPWLYDSVTAATKD